MSSSPKHRDDATPLLQPLPPFDLDALESKWQESMRQVCLDETALLSEFKQLCIDIELWAKSRIEKESLEMIGKVREDCEWIESTQETMEQTRKNVVSTLDALKNALKVLVQP
ncbi:hypothetical protein NEOLI_001175 [Neolecta irregularis DAH-3]|uniref:Uncharacterized protein n=1 Tax=Neolecta irregularis (strain DAH-3) TaxID=1198029 RepID=A0A1U7LS53_NEOID|nr:hypothetical protein NEOLI_001175 [Neolecta irregularis DAH-3]|eukprot:OLL25474.1 hypothetical protein NEOLI_001175 [Neolecta irregularis DAH-3]